MLFTFCMENISKHSSNIISNQTFQKVTRPPLLEAYQNISFNYINPLYIISPQ